MSKFSSNLSRRLFFRNAGISTAAVVGWPCLVSSTPAIQEMKERLNNFFRPGSVVLFQGDSITDAGRNRKKEIPNDADSFGSGYAFLIASFLLKVMPEKDLTLYNRGISGNKVYQLTDRWEKDCLDLRPDVLSILIGVNDYWHMREGKYDGTPEIYESGYRNLLKLTRSGLPDVKLIVCEPFILPETRAVDESWLEPFRAYQEIAARIAGEFEATWVPFQSAFTGATGKAPATYWTRDGVHPSMPGAQLMADTWIQAL